MERLRELRKSKKMTMKELAKVFGVSESTISLYETGKREPDNSMLKRLADYFGVSVDYLLERSPNVNYRIPLELQGIPIAFYEGLKDLSEEDLNSVAKYVKFLKSQKK